MSELPEALMVAAIALLGLLLGSFTTMMVYRIPREIPLGLTSHTRSRCTSCNKVIPWYWNIPVISYLWLRGRCGQCKAPIAIRYLLIELLTPVFFVVTYLVYQNSTDRPFESWAYWAELAKLLFFVVALIATIFIDLEFRIIPDRFSIGCWIVALGAAVAWGTPPWELSLVGGLVGAGLFFLMAWGYEKLKGIEGLGLGDVKMLGWLGSWVGLLGVPAVILIASITGLAAGLIAMRRSSEGLKTAIPFGPFLAIAGYLVWVSQALGWWALPPTAP